MPYALPKELSEAEWKKHKANLATDTGVSEKLRDVAKAAGKVDGANLEHYRGLVTQIEKLVESASKHAKGLLAPFAKTKTYLQKMVVAANKTKGEVGEAAQVIVSEAARKEAKRAERAKEAAVQAIMQKCSNFEAFRAALREHGAAAGLNERLVNDFIQAMFGGKGTEARAALNGLGLDIPARTFAELVRQAEPTRFT